MQSANAPDQAVRLMFSQIKSHNLRRRLRSPRESGDVDKNAFIREFEGSYGSLLTYASLENFDVSPLHTGDQESSVRVRLHYSTAVGPLDDVRDLKVEKSGDTWKVFWPVEQRHQASATSDCGELPALGRDSARAGDDWGVQNADTPQVRILSMNAIQRPDSVVLVGEVVNEDSVPAL